MVFAKFGIIESGVSAIKSARRPAESFLLFNFIKKPQRFCEAENKFRPSQFPAPATIKKSPVKM